MNMTNIIVAHLEVSVLSDSHGHIGLLLVEAGAVHGDARLVSLKKEIFLTYCSFLLVIFTAIDLP